ncbi:MAG: hypothetical protein QM796_19120 [Chthoniobacteraceae bacterium]
MKPNEILDQIYRSRAEIMEECGDDLDRLFALVKSNEEAAKKEGRAVVSLEEGIFSEPTAVIRDEAAGE